MSDNLTLAIRFLKGARKGIDYSGGRQSRDGFLKIIDNMLKNLDDIQEKGLNSLNRPILAKMIKELEILHKYERETMSKIDKVNRHSLYTKTKRIASDVKWTIDLLTKVEKSKYDESKIPVDELLDSVYESATPIKRPHIDALKIEMKHLRNSYKNLSDEFKLKVINRKALDKIDELINQSTPVKSNYIRIIIKELQICYDGINKKLKELGNSLFKSNDKIKIALHKGMGDVKEVVKRLEAIESSQKHSKITAEEFIKSLEDK